MHALSSLLKNEAKNIPIMTQTLNYRVLICRMYQTAQGTTYENVDICENDSFWLTDIQYNSIHHCKLL